jgi:DNA polymerase III sliding clamp (beta) subunit (PCNA family)
MKLDTRLLTPAVHFMKNFIADRDIVPAYKHFYFSGEALRAYSGTAGAAYYGLWPKKGFVEPFSLQADSVVKILSSLTDQDIEEVDISDIKAGKMVLKGGRFKSSIPALQGDDLKDFMTPTTKVKGLEVTKEFWDGVEQLLFAVCLDETKPALRSLYIAPSGTLVATDGLRIAILRGSKFKPPKALLLP